MSSASSAAARDGSKKLRAGYLGHLTLVGSTLAQMAKTNSGIRDALAKEPQFSTWTEDTLKGRLEAEDTDLWSFGRPTSRKGTSTGVSVDELDGFSVPSLGPLSDKNRLPPLNKR